MLPIEPDLTQATVTHMRASALSGLFQTLDARDPQLRSTLIAGLSVQAQKALGHHLGPFEWVEVPLVNELVEAYEAQYGLVDLEHRVHRTAHQQLTLIHAWMLKLLTPETIFHQAATIFRFYYRGGEVKAERVQPGRAELSIWAVGIYTSWHGHAFPAWLRGALGLIGAREVQVLHTPPEAGCRHHYEITWNR